jgi:hypothetical protein
MEFKRTEPPFGASGFTYSKWLKPSGYLADPFIAIDEALIRSEALTMVTLTPMMRLARKKNKII